MPSARQILTTPQVRLPQKEEVVESALFTPRRIALVFAQLVVAQTFESFPLSSRLLVDSLLLVSQVLPAQQFVFRIVTTLVKRCLASHCKTQLRRGGASAQFLRFAELHLPDAFVNLFDETAGFRYLLVGRAETQLLLMF